MLILRATQKVLRNLPNCSAGDTDVSDTALGDWYAHRTVVDRQPLLLLVSSASLLPIVTPARDVGSLPARLPELIADRLRRMDIDLALIGAEMEAMHRVCVGKTTDRSTVGIAVQYAFMLPSYLAVGRHDTKALQSAEDQLAETPCRVTRRGGKGVIFPRDATPRLLTEKWRPAQVSGGFEPIPARGGTVSNDLVNKLREDDIY